MSKNNVEDITDEQAFILANGVDMNKVVCQITWTVQDFADAFAERHHRMPTNEELTKCISNFAPTKMQDYCIENGWNFIYEAVDKL